MTVREMKREDVPAVEAIEQATFSAPWSSQSFLDALASKDTIYLVAVEEKLVGYAGIWLSYETADLCNLAVSASFRRQHIAQRLLQELLQLVKERGAERVLLEVRQSNEGAAALYEKNGFERIGIRRGYYSKPKEDAVLMQCRLV